MPERETAPVSTVLDELVFVGRCGPAEYGVDRPPPVRIITDPEPDEPALTLRQRVSRALALTLVSATIILVIGLAVGYAG